MYVIEGNVCVRVTERGSKPPVRPYQFGIKIVIGLQRYFDQTDSKATVTLLKCLLIDSKSTYITRHCLVFI